MTESNKHKIELLSGLISEVRRSGALPDIEEGMIRLEGQIKTIESPNSRLEDKVISDCLDQIDTVLRGLIRLARVEKDLSEIKKAKWRLK